MKKFKICVYAICKNEESFVDRFMDSVKDADCVVVLDTGSTDNTVEKLRNRGAIVTIKEFKPWRFDVARNKSLSLVPEDANICICLDLDEVIRPGWRKVLEEIWDCNTTRLAYDYNWQLDNNNNPVINFYIEKIHARRGYYWHHPVHEVLHCSLIENKKITDLIVVDHYPNDAKSRGSYLPLLELAVQEDPEDDRNMHYLGREYMFYGKYNDCIETLIKHLNLKRATWRDERGASMRFIARSYRYMKRYDEARLWLNKAILETPYLREPYMEMALANYELEDWKMVEMYILLALEITKKEKLYINEVFSWNETPYDLLALSYYYQERYQESLEAVKNAIIINPDNKRLLKNKRLILKKLKRK